MATKKETATQTVEVMQLKRERVQVPILGLTPLIINSVSNKVMRQLLLPPGRKNAAERATSLKHDPLAEFRAAPYYLPRGDDPTLLAGSALWFKASMTDAALDLPGAAKSQVGRLTYVDGTLIPVWGVPQLLMSVVRSADINRTPDIRTRCIVPNWATTITITFASPLMNLTTITNLLMAAGMIRGVGDWRPQKGKGDFGQFKITGPQDEDWEQWQTIVAQGGRAAQQAHMEAPTCYDLQSEDLLAWFQAQVKTKGLEKLLADYEPDYDEDLTPNGYASLVGA